jgi:hypothetical protein
MQAPVRSRETNGARLIGVDNDTGLLCLGSEQHQDPDDEEVWTSTKLCRIWNKVLQ